MSALSVFRKKINLASHQPGHVSVYGSTELQRIDALIKQGTAWIVSQQQRDGGWGDTDRSPSNPSTTLLAKCAILLSRTVEDLDNEVGATSVHGMTTIKNHPLLRSPHHDSIISGWSMDVLTRADLYLRRNGGMDAIYKRYGNDRTFSVPILTNAALAGLVPWRDVPPLPFEFAWFPQSLFRILSLPVVSYAIPALVAIGQVIHDKNPAKNPLLRKIRDAVRKKTLEKVLQMQPESGGFLEATPLTAFVVMSLSACDSPWAGAEHPIVQNGVRFLLDSVREDGSWPIDTNLAGWVTSLAVNALEGEKGRREEGKKGGSTDEKIPLSWILGNQHRKKHPFTGAAPGGWAWTDLSGGVPDVDDTAGALLAVHTLTAAKQTPMPQETLQQVGLGIRWLLSLQNRDGGWPTFCKGWNRFPFDRSGVDLTAHAVRALLAWKNVLLTDSSSHESQLVARINKAIARGAKYLLQSQQNDGSWLPLWFGNQYHSREENPIYGTAKVLSALGELRQAESSAAYDDAIIKALRFVVANVNEDGGFGCLELPQGKESFRVKKGKPGSDHYPSGSRSGIEETALLIEALVPLANEPVFRDAVVPLSTNLSDAVHWLVEQVENGRFTHAAPIGLYFTKLWYDEKLYPLIFTTDALASVLKETTPIEKPVNSD